MQNQCDQHRAPHAEANSRVYLRCKGLLATAYTGERALLAIQGPQPAVEKTMSEAERDLTERDYK